MSPKQRSFRESSLKKRNDAGDIRRRRSNDKAVMVELLTELASNDREALSRFYFDLQPHEKIESALGLNADYFRDLRCSVKAAFLKRTGRGC